MHRKGLRDILIHEMCDIVASANHSISMYNHHQSMKEEMRQIYQNQCNSRWARHAPIKTNGDIGASEIRSHGIVRVNANSPQCNRPFCRGSARSCAYQIDGVPW